MADMHEKLAEAARALKDAKRDRDRLIVEASDAGLSRREVARAVGLTPAGVQHVIRLHRQRSGAGR